MTDQQRRRTSELFGLAPADRAASLAGIDDPEVRAELESLLAHATESAESATEAVGDLVRAASAGGAFDGRTVGAGVRLGPYRVERRLGQGGMGHVMPHARPGVQLRSGRNSMRGSRSLSGRISFLAADPNAEFPHPVAPTQIGQPGSRAVWAAGCGRVRKPA